MTKDKLLAAALGVITLKNPVHSALCLVLTFFTAAGIWLLVQAEFLAIVLVLVYVGAVMVLFLFVVMMLDIDIESLRSGFTRHVWLGIATAVILALEIVGVVVARGLGSRLEMKSGMAPVAADASSIIANVHEMTMVFIRSPFPVRCSLCTVPSGSHTTRDWTLDEQRERRMEADRSDRSVRTAARCGRKGWRQKAD